VIYREDFLSLLESNFELVHRVIEALTERLRFTTTFSQNLAFLSASGRIAAALAQRAAREAKTADPVRLALTQQDLANHASVTREWTNKALRDFAAQGLLRVERGAVIVLDQERLGRWSEA
jgi:CRP/FNR family cyclic AMP-dependent transcriptional regulator